MGGGSSKNVVRPAANGGRAEARNAPIPPLSPDKAAPANRQGGDAARAADVREEKVANAHSSAQRDEKTGHSPAAAHPTTQVTSAADTGSVVGVVSPSYGGDVRMRRRSSWVLASEPKSRSCIRALLTQHLGAPRAVDLVLGYVLVPRVIVCGGLRTRKEVEAQTTAEFLTWPPVGSIPAPPDSKEGVVINSAAAAAAALVLGVELESKQEAASTPSLQWRSLPPLPLPLYDSCCVTIENCLYVVGGCSRVQTGSSPRATRSLFCFDTETQVWTKLKSMEIARSGFAATVYNGRIYVFGGQPVESAAHSAEVYDPSSDTWTLLPHPLPDALYFHSAITHGDNIILLRRGAPHCFIFSPSAGKCVRAATDWLSPTTINVGATAMLRVPLLSSAPGDASARRGSAASLPDVLAAVPAPPQLQHQYGPGDLYALDMEGNCALSTSGLVLRLPPDRKSVV